MRNVKLSSIADIYSGLSYRRYLDEEGVNYDVVVQRSIKGDGIIDDFEEVKLKNNLKERFFSKSGDVLMKMSYPFDVVQINQEGIVISDRVAIIRLKPNFDSAFIAHLLTNAHVKKQLHQSGRTEKISHMSIKEIKEISLNIPDYSVQVKYGNLLNTIDEKIAQDLRVVDYDRRLKEGILNNIWCDIDD
ncbi:restriction endonuclease subunit S [Methanobrevibacter sp.]|uniref:restriction endonuclease subunit S n=1 Tax=Methanobrevibacter sp. TaxID=66852 RepID=UPI003D7DC005